MIELVPPTYGEISLEENLPILVENGIRIVHITGNHLPYMQESEVLKIARTYREKGIRIYAGHSPGGSLASLDERERKETLEGDKDVLHKLALMGAEILVFHGGKVEEEEQIPLAKAALLKSLMELVEVAKREGVKLALENDSVATSFPRALVSQGGKVQRELIDEVGSPWLGACFDTGHANVFGRIREHMEILGERIITIHMQDNEGRADQHMQPPYGTVDWGDFGEVLRNIGYDRSILIESGPRGDAPFGRMMQECSALFNDLGLDTGTPFTFRVARFLTGRDLDVRVQCPRCGHYVQYDGQECSCMCGKWPIPGRAEGRK